MTTLAIETATANREHPASIALNGELKVLTQPNSQAAQLVSAIEGMLSARGLWYTDLQRLIVTVGPGSFTGIRIGLSVARSIAFACPNLSLIAVSSLEALAAKYDQPHTAFTAILRAGKGDVYAQPYQRLDGKWQAESEIALLAPEAIPTQTPLYGNGIEAHQAQIDALDVLAAIDRVKLEEYDAVPLYIRPPDAKLPQRGAL